MHKLHAKGSAAPLALLFTVVSMYFTTAYLNSTFIDLIIIHKSSGKLYLPYPNVIDVP